MTHVPLECAKYILPRQKMELYSLQCRRCTVAILPPKLAQEQLGKGTHMAWGKMVAPSHLHFARAHTHLPNHVLAFIHMDSTFHWFHTLKSRQPPAIIEISRTQVHTGTPHTFCHTNTVITCVFVKTWAFKNRQRSRLYTQSRHFTGFMLSTSAKLRHS